MSDNGIYFGELFLVDLSLVPFIFYKLKSLHSTNGVDNY